MKLPKIFTSFFSNKQFATPSVTKGEMGGSGTTIYRGVVSDVEYNSSLSTEYGQSGLTIYERMRKSDPVIKSTLKAINLTIQQAEFFVSPASDEAKDIEIKEFVEDALFKKLSQSWQELIEIVLTYLPFGFSVFEKVFKIDGSMIYWDKFAFRSQTSIVKFETEDGERGITQRLQGDMTGKEGQEPSIPIEKLLVFSNEKEGDNWRGVSLLRAAYKPWFFKENAEKIDMIGFERQAVGVPVFKMPPNPTPQDVAMAEELGENLRANEKAYLLLPDGWECEILNMKAASTRDASELIKRFNRDIYANVMAQFLDLGSYSQGSYALAKTQGDPFYRSVKSIASYICSIFNSYAIKQLVDLNFDGVKEYPLLDVTGIENIDYESFSAALQRLVMSGLIVPDSELEDYLRDVMGLPERVEEEQDTRETPEKPQKEKEDDLEDEKLNKSKVKTKKFSEYWRPKTMAEEKVNFTSLQRHFDKAEELMAESIQKILTPQIDMLLDQARRALETGNPKEIVDIAASFKEDLRTEIIEQIRSSFEAGKISASNELDVLAPKTTNEMINIMTTRADAVADKLVNDLISKTKLNTLSYIEQKTPIDDAVNSLRIMLEDQIMKSVRLGASNTVVGGVNQGRMSVFDDNEGMIYGYQRSELLDDRVCDYCLSMDGRVIAPDDSLRNHDQFHYNCRGIWVAISKEESNKPSIGGVPDFLRKRAGTLDEFAQIDKVYPLEGSLAEEFIK